MPAKKPTYIYCLDDHRSFSDDVRKKFSDHDLYDVCSFQNTGDLREKLFSGKGRSMCRIVIIGLNDNDGQMSMVSDLVKEIKDHDAAIGVIILYSADKINEPGNSISNADAFVTKNSNMILRIHNAVKKHISEHTIRLLTKRRNLSILIISIFAVASAIAALLAYLRYPQYF
jgi:hypothetical protein